MNRGWAGGGLSACSEQPAVGLPTHITAVVRQQGTVRGDMASFTSRKDTSVPVSVSQQVIIHPQALTLPWATTLPLATTRLPAATRRQCSSLQGLPPQ